MEPEDEGGDMALIKCHECGDQISDKAAACFKCGAPVATSEEYVATGTQLTTVQETSKKLKKRVIISLCLILFGTLLGVVMKDNPKGPGLLPGLMILAGITLYIVTKGKIWWHHK